MPPVPNNSIAIVGEREGEIIGRAFILNVAHLEGPWVKEGVRGGILANRLVMAAIAKAKQVGLTKLFAYAATERIEQCLKVLGFEKSSFTVWTRNI